MGTIRTTVTICLLCLVSVIGSAEPLPVQRIEGEIRAGMGLPFDNKYYGNKSYGALNVGLELRYNFKNTGWDCGVIAQIVNNGYESEEPGPSISHSYWGLSFCGNFNFRQGHRINPFAGLALGTALTDDGSLVLVSPRVGVEFLHHIRISAELNISRRYYNNACLTLGIVFGGRPKNPK